MLETLGTLIAYQTAIVPHAHRELRRWAQVAATIPDPTLRDHATGAIEVDTGNAVAIAALAATAPRRLRRPTVELLVTYQVLVDYIDRLGERVCVGQLLRSLRVGLALASAVDRPTSQVDIDPLGDDGGYLASLVASCRDRLWSLPSAEAIQEHAHSAAIRCCHALAYTHAAVEHGTLADVRRWTAAQQVPDGYSWWELAAGGVSNIAITALLAAASDPATSPAAAAEIATAYWPHICVLTTMLDSLVDYERDVDSGGFSFISHYPGPAAARDRLIHATRLSLTAVRPLRHSHTHTMIVRGVVGYYAASAAAGNLASEIAPSVVAELGHAATPVILALHARDRRSGPVRSRTAGFLTRLRGSVRGPGGSGSSTTNRDGTGDYG